MLKKLQSVSRLFHRTARYEAPEQVTSPFEEPNPIVQHQALAQVSTSRFVRRVTCDNKIHLVCSAATMWRKINWISFCFLFRAAEFLNMASQKHLKLILSGSGGKVDSWGSKATQIDAVWFGNCDEKQRELIVFGLPRNSFEIGVKQNNSAMTDHLNRLDFVCSAVRNSWIGGAMKATQIAVSCVCSETHKITTAL